MVADGNLASSTASLLIPSKLLHHLLSAYPTITSTLPHYLLLILNVLVSLLRLLVSLALSLTAASTKPIHASHRPPLPRQEPDEDDDNGKNKIAISRALSDVLAVMARVPVWSRKYELVRDLADRLIDENLRCGGSRLGEVNRASLSSAFARTVRRVEAEAGEREMGDVWSVFSRVRRWAKEVVAEEGERRGEEFNVAAEKMAAELLWLAEKMAECGAAGEAVRLWGKAEGIARIAVDAEPKLQAAFLKVSAFLFKHVEETERIKAEDPGQLREVVDCRMNMLMSWLPLLCRAANGTDAPVLSSSERSEIVKVLEQIIEKLSSDQQDRVLTLWLHNFSACPHSDWPNLQSCYIKWYGKSRKLLID